MLLGMDGYCGFDIWIPCSQNIARSGYFPDGIFHINKVQIIEACLWLTISDSGLGDG